jgi:hypothetical protein
MLRFTTTWSNYENIWTQWGRGVCTTLVPLVWHIWFSLATSSGLDWLFDGGCTQPHKFCSVHSECSAVLSAACLNCLCLGCVEWEKPSSIQKFRESSIYIYQLLNKVKLYSYRWLRTTNVTLTFNIHCWWLNPMLCLRIDWLLHYLVIFGSSSTHLVC